jgi:ectoine hydroxylase-related dioxygenase (phytanoyl-CoA dioxygenase family)
MPSDDLSEGAIMPLSEAGVRQFREQGYVAVPDFFNRREVLAIRAELDRLKAAGAFRNVSTEGDGKTHSTTKQNLQICPLYNKSDFFRALPFQQKVLDTIPRLIGDPVVLHLDQVFLKPARHGSGTSWHQDNAYFKIPDPFRGTAMWTAVHDATIANGTIEVIPGMTREKLEHARDPGSDHHIRCYPDESKAVPVELPAGGVVFFAYGTPHCTRGNNTDSDRAGLAYHFFHQSQLKPGDSAITIGTILTGPDATGGKKEYGVDLSDAWEQLVEKATQGPEGSVAAGGGIREQSDR